MSEKIYENKLKSSDLTLEDAEYLGLKLLTPQETQNFHPKAPPNPSILIKYHDMAGHPIEGDGDRIRILGDPIGFQGAAKKPPRFFQKPGAMPQVYIPRHPSIYWIPTNLDPNIPLIITEGELKAACAVKHGLPCVAIGGVYSWRSKAHGCGLLPELRDTLNLTKRKVYLIFDSDAQTNPDVKYALARFAESLIRLCGAYVYFVDIPEIPAHPKTGIDDFIVVRGVDGFKAFIETQAYSADLHSYLLGFDQRCVFVPTLNSIVNRHSLVMTKTTAALSVYGDLRYPCLTNRVAFKSAPTVKAWLEWPGRTEVRSLCFKPDKTPRSVVGDEFNIWSGLTAKPVEGPVALWHTFLNHLLPNEEERLWIERWIGWRFQNLHLKPFTAICLYSTTQGTGKTFLTKIIEATIGKELFTELTVDDYKKQFNRLLEGKLFAYVAEAYNYGDTNYSTKLKQSVTNTSINIEPKGIDAYPVEDLNAWIFTSNHPDALYLEESDRRFYVVEVTDKLWPLEEANKIEAWYQSPEGRGALLHHFQTMDLQGFDARRAAPMTEAKHRMTANSQTGFFEWLKDLYEQSKERDMSARFDGCILRPAKEVFLMWKMECDEEDRVPYNRRTVANTLEKAGFRRVNYHRSKKDGEYRPGVGFKIGYSPTNTFWLMDPTRVEFYDMEHGELVVYLKAHYGGILGKVNTLKLVKIKS